MSYYKSYLDRKNAGRVTPVFPVSTPAPPKKPNFFSKLLNPWAITAVVSILTVTLAGFFVFNLYNQQKKLNSNILGTSDPNKSLLDEVSRLFKFPDGETPTIANVTDVEKLRQTQPFFQNAINGDKLLIFSKKAVLYRPEEKKIIDIGPVNITKETTPSP